VKLFLEELVAPDRLDVRVDGTAMADLDLFCTDPIKMRFEVNFALPETIGAGPHKVELRMGSRAFAPAGIEVL